MTEELLLHYSKNPLKEIRSVEQSDTHVERAALKPAGIWVSIGTGEDSWEAWCRSQEFCVDHLANVIEIILSPNANILRLHTLDDILGFTKTYAVEYARLGKMRLDMIDWNTVAAEYDGLFIYPYCYDARMRYDTAWYYPWDCASGCIWDATAIKELKLRP